MCVSVCVCENVCVCVYCVSVCVIVSLRVRECV